MKDLGTRKICVIKFLYFNDNIRQDTKESLWCQATYFEIYNQPTLL